MDEDFGKLDFLKIFGRAGYRLDERFDFLPVQNLLIFRPVDSVDSS